MSNTDSVNDGESDLRPADFTSLDDSERFVQLLLQTSEAQKRIHARSEDQRCRLIYAFAQSNSQTMRKRAERLSQCCKWPLLMVRKDGTTGISLQRCRDRLCPVCSNMKGLETSRRCKAAVQAMDDIRFMTLTIQSTEKTLCKSCDDLHNGFRELRRSEAWKSRVVGGLWTMEIKPGTKEGTWNVHLHLLVDGEYFPQDLLSEAWKKATGDSYIVDVRAVNSRSAAIHYITKYIAKPGDFSKFSDEEIIDFATSVKGRRLFGTFGKLHASIKAEKEIEPETVSPNAGSCISFHNVRAMATARIPEAERALHLLRRCGGFYSLAAGGEWSPNGEKFTEEDRKELSVNIVYLISCVDRERAVLDAANEVLRLNSLKSGLHIPRVPKSHAVQIVIDDWLQRGVWSRHA